MSRDERSRKSPPADSVGREFIECDFKGCGRPAPQMRCSRCQAAYYCGAACQRRYWQDHKPHCRDVGWMREQLAGVGVSDSAPAYALDEVEARAAAVAAAEEQGCCGICLEDPIVDPFVLPGCGHAFCFGCLRRWQETTRRSTSMTALEEGSEGHPKLSCPSCRSEAADAEDFVIDKARLYAERGNRRGLAEAERAKYRDLALAELDRALKSNEGNLQALVYKVDVLLALGRPEEVLETLDKIVKTDSQGRKNASMVNGILEQVKIASEEGRDDDAEAMLNQVDEMISSGMDMHRLKGAGDTALFDVYIRMGEAKEAMEDWKGAKGVYTEKLLSKMDDPTIGTPPQQRMVWMGLSRCLYELGDYEKSISAGQAAIEMNRHFPGVHKYVALSQKASGDLDAAIRTMGRAVNYETPWDEDNKQKVLEMYHELLMADI